MSTEIIRYHEQPIEKVRLIKPDDVPDSDSCVWAIEFSTENSGAHFITLWLNNREGLTAEKIKYEKWDSPHNSGVYHGDDPAFTWAESKISRTHYHRAFDRPVEKEDLPVNIRQMMTATLEKAWDEYFDKKEQEQENEENEENIKEEKENEQLYREAE